MCLEALVYWVCRATATLARPPPLREMSATWSVFRERLFLTTLSQPSPSLACTHTKAGHPIGSHCSHPVKDRWVTPVGTEWQRKGGNHTPERPDTPSPWVSAAHVSQVSLNQRSFYTAAGARCVNVCAVCGPMSFCACGCVWPRLCTLVRSSD